MKRIKIALVGVLLWGFFQPLTSLAEKQDDSVTEEVAGNLALTDSLPVEKIEEQVLPEMAVTRNDLTSIESVIPEVTNDEEIQVIHSSVEESKGDLLSVPLPTSSQLDVKENRQIASGRFGTSSWYITSEGVLHIGSGEFVDVPAPNGRYSISPWLSWSKQINKIQFDGPVLAANSINNLFDSLSKVTAIENIEYLNTSQTTLMQRVFADCSSLVTLDLTSWDTSQVTTIFSLFNGCLNMEQLDVSNWNASNMTTLTYAFSDMPKLTTLDLSKWQATPVNVVQGLFMGDSVLTYLDLSGFDFSKLDASNSYAMSRFFQKNNSLKTLN
ncbi:BspA family leucine-rich repeat surface protein [Isobaculum melis]|uniref:Surface protein n=1 Tax=Isobaculum melis TaxID=142588 RepID=A0A1H9SE32_9LACT|nr:BspA family leucine-rich repeat surface protein [Isobaculum melis]SER82623.1 surface protein [Isobaculum melis]